MLSPDFQPRFLDEQDCKENATRQILSFITLPDTKEGDPLDERPAPGASLFLFDDLQDAAFSDGRELFNWKSRDIYDVDGLLLFRDLTLQLASGREWHVRTAASDLLQTPVWCACAPGGPAPDHKTLIEKALEEIRRYPDLEPFIVDDEENVRLVAYNPPNLGILCYSQSDPHARFVSKLGEPLIIPIEPYSLPENPQSLLAVWSPYDLVGRHTVTNLRRLSEQNTASLPPLPQNHKDLPDAIRKARKVADPGEHIVHPLLTLIPQKNPKTCAVAATRMLLKHHHIDIDALNVTEDEIAKNMKCDFDGAPLADEVTEVNRLLGLAGSNLKAVPDVKPPFERARAELAADRPLQIGSGHARVAAGFRADAGGTNWLWVFDPLPENLGTTCCVAFVPGSKEDFMYVRP